VVKQWAPESILNAYEEERLPITDQVSRLAMAKVLEHTAAIGSAVPPVELSDPGPDGQTIRDHLAPILRDVNLPQFAPAGLNFGYYYDNSPIICYNGDTPPAYSMGEVTPSAVPGCRMPHFDVDGVPVLDLLGSDYTLLRFDASVDVGSFMAHAQSIGLPIVLVDVPWPREPDVFKHKLTIVRFDQHVAWTGDQLSDDAHLTGVMMGAGT
jgi:hypothetical protein